MGGLRKKMPITAVTFIVGWLAIAGVPFFAGFFSKDEILLVRLRQEPGAVGRRPGRRPAHRLLHEPPGVPGLLRRAPLGPPDRRSRARAGRRARGRRRPRGPRRRPVGRDPPARVAVDHDAAADRPRSGSRLVGGWLNSPFWERGKFLEHWLEPVVEFGEAHLDRSHHREDRCSAVGATLVGLIGIGHRLRSCTPATRARRPTRSSCQVLAKGWYYDSSISAFMGGPGRKAFDAVAWFDSTVIDGAVNGVGSVVCGSAPPRAGSSRPATCATTRSASRSAPSSSPPSSSPKAVA